MFKGHQQILVELQHLRVWVGSASAPPFSFSLMLPGGCGCKGTPCTPVPPLLGGLCGVNPLC